MNLSIIIVSYNQTELLKNCINSIYKSTRDINFEVIVVDNNSEDRNVIRCLEYFLKKYNNFIFKKNDSNMGFAAANNIGVKLSRGKYIIFLNPDTILLNNCFKIMFDYMERDESIGICGPRLFNPDFSLQVSFYSFPGILKELLKVLGINKMIVKNPVLVRRISRFKKILPGYASIFSSNFEKEIRMMEVPWVTGACFIVKSSLFKKIGGFDEKYKMYCEDMDLCLRAGNKGYKVLFIPEANVIHYRGWKSRSLKTLDYHFKSYEYYYIKHFKNVRKIILVFLNKIEWSYEKLFFIIRNKVFRK